MESLVQFLPSTALFTCLILILVTTLKIAYAKISRKKANLPPGPWKLPITGNLHQLMSSLPHRRLRDLARKHGGLMHLQLGELSFVVVSSADAAHEIFRTHNLIFCQRPFIGAAKMYDFKNIVFAPYGEYWLQLRRICAQDVLSPARIRSLDTVREEETADLIGYLRSASGSPVNLSEKLFSWTYGQSAKAAFGKKSEEPEVIIETIEEGMRLAGGLSVSELFPSQKWLHWITRLGENKLEKFFEKTDEALQNMVDDCRADKAARSTEKDEASKRCWLEILLDIQENGDLAFPMETLDIKANVLDLFIAGSDSLYTCLEWSMFEMLKNPRVMEKAQNEVRQVFGRAGNVDESRLNELKYLKLIIKESLRLHPPAPLLLPRESRESCVISGYDIPAKTRVLINAWAIGRDPRYWNEPESFYPERFIDSSIDFRGSNFEFIPFGGGRRMCPGMSYAVALIELLLAQLLFHFDWKLPDGTSCEDLDTTEIFSLVARRREQLYAVPVPWNSNSAHVSF